MSAVILAFPRCSPTRVLCRSDNGSAPFTPAWCAQHLPLIDAAMDLLEADDAEFGRRCQLMRDEDGRAMLDELAGQLQWPGSYLSSRNDRQQRSISCNCRRNPARDRRSGKFDPQEEAVLAAFP